MTKKNPSNQSYGSIPVACAILTRQVSSSGEGSLRLDF